MLPKEERLKDRSLFNTIFNKRYSKTQKLTTKLFSLYFLYKKNNINRFDVSKVSKSKVFPKVAFIAPFKLDKRATKRNLFKRRMRAAYQLIKKQLIDLNNNYPSVLIWIANPFIKDATFEQIKNSMEYLIKKIERAKVIHENR